MICNFNVEDLGVIIEADLCIVGGGMAGLSLAREFLGTDVQVCVLESGGFDFEAETQDLYEQENVGLPRSPQAISRLRLFGGSSALWAGRCAPLSKQDFAKRDWVTQSGWPIEHESLTPYYLKANQVLGLGPHVYDSRLWKLLDTPHPDPFQAHKLQDQFWQFSSSWMNPKGPVRFGRDFRAELEQAENIQILLHANVFDIVSEGQGQHVTELQIKTLNGWQGSAKARHYVLACGGIENSRLLLASQGDIPTGLGNQNDQVGRYFMEHPRGTCAEVVGKESDIERLQKRCGHHWLDDARGKRHVYLSGVGASDTLQRKQGILNVDVSLVVEENVESGTRAAERLLKGGSSDKGEDAWLVLKDLDEVASNSVRRYVQQRPPIIEAKKVSLECHVEQAPNKDSRITLSSEKDALGMPRSKMNWVLGQQEQRTIQELTIAIGAEFGRLQLGRVKLADWVMDPGENWTRGVQDVAHHMGGTRMSTSPHSGVVNGDCKVHQTDNLYIAGSSVFPTSGCVNPTLTIVALSIRLADHLKQRLQSSRRSA